MSVPPICGSNQMGQHCHGFTSIPVDNIDPALFPVRPQAPALGAAKVGPLCNPILVYRHGVASRLAASLT
ncbi:hypothetical protein [Sphingomonas phyllosphaerae]|uniref:hypothetical protein n=1 Tax=Sphingomonas phyllosphaerae TaxID=257003 RepID=UPI002FF627B9